MAQIPNRSRRKAVRYGIPVAVAGVAAASVGLVPAIASAGSPELPKITAEQLVAKMAKSDVKHFSGTVKTSTDLGLPSLPGGAGGGQEQGGGSPFDGGGAHGKGDGKSAEAGGGSDSEGGGSADPQQKLMELASGTHTLRVAADGPDKQRVSMVEKAAEYSFVHNGKDVWGYDSGSNSAYHATAPKNPNSAKDRHATGHGLQDATPQKAAQQALKAVSDTTSVSVDGTQTVAGRDAYQLVITPKGKGAADSTVDAIRVSVDAKNGVPLKFTLTPKGGGKPVIDTAFTDVDFGKPDAGTFDFKPPKGTKVTEHKAQKDGKALPGGKALPDGKTLPDGKKLPDGKTLPDGKKGPGEKGKPDMQGLNVLGEGWGSVAEIQGPKGGLGASKGGAEGGAQAERMLNSFTKEAKGDFGTGRVFSTRLVNALMTDDGKIYVGAVSKEGLIKAADRAAK